MVFLIYFSLFNCQKQNYRDVKLHSCECKMLSTKMERFMSVVNTIFYREAETEIVMFGVHLFYINNIFILIKPPQYLMKYNQNVLFFTI